MPYIPKENRKKYDDLIDSLAHILNTRADNDELSGDLNYALFRLARLLCDGKSGGKRGYARMAVVSAEFRRRVMVPYEDEKIGLAGDVEL